MKRNSKNSGFTLIELLAVIVILMILMGLIMAVVRDALKDATLNRARSEAWEIHNAVLAFFHEYGRLPLPVPEHHGAAVVYGDRQVLDKWYTDEDDLIMIYHILRGNPEGAEENPKRISFLRRSSNINLNEPPLVDPWGNAYVIAMDSTYGGAIDATRIPGDNPFHDKMKIEGIVSVRSAGPNGEWEDPTGRGAGRSDDILTGYQP